MKPLEVADEAPREAGNEARVIPFPQPRAVERPDAGPLDDPDRPSPGFDDLGDSDAVETFFSTPAPVAHGPRDFDDLMDARQRLQHQRAKAQEVGIATALGAFVVLAGFLFYFRSTGSQVEPTAPARVLPTPDLLQGVQMPGDEAVPVVEAPPVQAATVEKAAVAPRAENDEGVADGANRESARQAPTAAAGPAQPNAAPAPHRAYASLLEQARRAGMRREAETLYRRALAQRPDGARALSGLGMWQLNHGRNRQALASARRAVAHDPANSEGWIVLGAALDALGQHGAAHKAYRACADRAEGRYVRECRRMLP